MNICSLNNVGKGRVSLGTAKFIWNSRQLSRSVDQACIYIIVRYKAAKHQASVLLQERILISYQFNMARLCPARKGENANVLRENFNKGIIEKEK